MKPPGSPATWRRRLSYPKRLRRQSRRELHCWSSLELACTLSSRVVWCGEVEDVDRMLFFFCRVIVWEVALKYALLLGPWTNSNPICVKLGEWSLVCSCCSYGLGGLAFVAANQGSCGGFTSASSYTSWTYGAGLGKTRAVSRSWRRAGSVHDSNRTT